jgi:VWFA-related protein
MRIECVFGRLVAVALLVASPASAQQASPAPRLVTEAVRVNVVNVETFVSDRQGRPVTDLTAADFEIEEDGKPVALTNFFAGRKPESAQAGVVPATEPPAAQPGRMEGPQVDQEQRLNLVVFVDNGNISRVGRAAVFEQLRRLLKEGTRPGDRIGLVSFDRRLKESQAFTEQPAVALATLDRMAKESSEGTLIASEKSYLERSMATAEGSANVASGRGSHGQDATAAMARYLLEDIDSFNERNFQLYRSIMDGLIRFVDSLAGLPGRKVLLYVSEGLPMRVGQDLYDEWQARFPTIAVQMNFNPFLQTARFNITSYFRDVIHHANAGRVTIYSIDAKTDRGLEGMSSETPGMSAVPALGAEDTMNREVSMIAFASATGGKFLPNTPGLGETLIRMADDFTSYYSLGYSPAHLGDGKYHRLVVKVKRAGVKVRHREGYLDKPETERLADRTGAALLVAGDKNALEARVSFGEGRKEEGRVYRVPLTVTVPGAHLALLDQGAARAGRVTICMAAKDEEGRRAEPQCKSFDIAVPAERFAAWSGQAATFSFEVQLRKGRCRLAVTARDEVAQEETIVVRDVAVPGGSN